GRRARDARALHRARARRRRVIRQTIHCDWALQGLPAFGRADAVVVVDVFSFGTAVTLAVERGAAVYPWRAGVPPAGRAASRRPSAAGFARRENAILCTDRSRTTFSLSPESLLGIQPGTRL